ncbi:type II toxin-antitoxin system Phd/YefM family antitoxin [Brachybacterium muris]|uniref:type II toxin-antitoxin system Phd/YefM family antitoxin n=1 Tax=Brachybacterium muris TaxID=219301 RepID=UPI00223C07BB|nr:type II toxin-antitoxin system prevent-host-death family antitoxin [Brachybacterium muris]
MSDVTIRDLRNRSADVLRRVAHGESLTVTKDGEPVASVVPLPRKSLNVEELISRRRSLPRVDADELKADIDELIDPAL